MITMSDAAMRNSGFSDHDDPMDESHLPPLRTRAVPPRDPSKPYEHNIYVNGKLLEVGETVYFSNEEEGDDEEETENHSVQPDDILRFICGELQKVSAEESKDAPDEELTAKEYAMFESYPDVLDVSQLCDMLHIGRKSAYKLLHENQLSYRKIGRIYHIPKYSVIQFITSDDPASQSR